MARLLERYRAEVVPTLMERFAEGNRLAVPRLVKIVVSMGVGEAAQSPDLLGEASGHLAVIAGQKPRVCRARKSVSGFKLRKGMAIGLQATLRGRRMYEFLDRLVSVVLPRVRDFRGLDPNAFDGRGNYSLGLADQLVFPEVNIDQVEHPQGMNVTIVVSGGSDDRSRELLTLLGMPFRTA